ncbi:MAG: adenine phosphoribosyltransferase [Deltaproteobacteria bacterium]|nr:adenine phosphoribosyltransferase [Deltaproteobacteria bacterium]
MREWSPELATKVRERIRDVPDFPKPGIMFKDLTPVFAHGPTFRSLIEGFAERYSASKIDAIVGIEARGFILAAPLATALGAGMVILRKPGKLPWKTHSQTYALEYGTDTLELHQDAVREGMRVVIMDDLLATGGTMSAAVQLVNRLGGHVHEAGFVVELAFLAGRTKLPEGTRVASLVSF